MNIPKKYKIEILPEYDEIPVRGNLCDSGNAEADTQDENKILARLDRGEVWAWACVEVRVTDTETGLTESEHLGGCCYDSEADFREGGYFEDMAAECVGRLETRAGLKRISDAAPDLLAAAKNAANVFAALATGQLAGVSPDSPALLQLRAAIAQAEGRAAK